MSNHLPVADTPAVRTYVGRLARRHPKMLWGALTLHIGAALTALAAPKLLGDLVQAVQNGTTVATSTRPSPCSPASWSSRRS